METVKTVGFLISAASSYAALLYKLLQIRRGWRDAAYLWLLATIVFQCTTFTMGAMAMGSSSLFGIGNLAILGMHLAAVGMCISALITMLLSATPFAQVSKAIYGWLGAGAGLVAALVALFFIGDAPHRPAADLATGSKDPIILTYLLLFMVSQAIPCVTIFRQCSSYIRMTTKPWLRRGLRLLRISTAVLFCYCATRWVNTVSPLFGVDIGGWQIAPSLLSAAGIFLLSVSLTMPSWGIHVSKVLRWLRHYNSYRALYPLWHSLYQASPEIVLEPPSPSLTDLHYRVHRRVIEIRDGWRALRPYMPDEPHEQQANGTALDEDRQAAIEAMRIREAIHAKASGCPPVNGDARHGFGDRNAKTFEAEVAWLTKVSLAYRRLASASRS